MLTVDGANDVPQEAVRDVQEKVNKGVRPTTAIKNWYPDVVLVRPLFRYSHGFSIYAMHDNFPDRRWDVGMVGFIFVTRQAIREHFGRERLSTKLIAEIDKYLAQDLEQYSAWVNGQVCGFMVKDSGIADLDDTLYSWYTSESEAFESAKDLIDQYREKEQANVQG